MGDRTSAGGTIYHADPAKLDRVIRIIKDVIGETPDEGEFKLGESWQVYEQSVATIGELARHLVNIDPTIIFVLHEDPCYEYSGDWIQHHPDTGLFDGNYVDGEVVVGLSQLETLFADGKTPTLADVRRLFGGHVNEAIEAWRRAPEEAEIAEAIASIKEAQSR